MSTRSSPSRAMHATSRWMRWSRARCARQSWPNYPGCGRTTSTFFQEMAEEIQTYLRQERPAWQARYPGSEELRVAVMGCVVNGPGESKHADIGISLPGTAEEPRAPVYVDGALRVTLKGDSIVADLRACGNSSACTIRPTRMSIFAKSS